MKKISPFSFTVVLILAMVLTGCGSGSGSSSNADEQAINTVFNSIGIDASSFFSSSEIITSSSIGTAPFHSANAPSPGVEWNSASFTTKGYTQSLTNIIFDSATTAHATANFSVTADYLMSGKAADSTPWSYSGNLSLSGSGTIMFVKTDGTWYIDQIPKPIYLSNSTNSPTIENLSIPTRAVSGTTKTISGTMTSHDTQYFEAFGNMTGFGATGSVSLGSYLYSTKTYEINKSITIPIFTGNIYGALTVIELASDGTSSGSTYYLNACAYIGMIKETTGT